METQEHFYTDDPAIGHADVRTRLPGVEYFFLGNGCIQAAVQVCRSGEGTPIGLLVMHPDRFGPKREALTCDLRSGLEETMVTVETGDSLSTPDREAVSAEWDDLEGVPAVRVTWQTGTVRVVERFYCPDRRRPRIARRIEIAATGGSTARRHLTLRTGTAEPSCQPLPLSADGSGSAGLVYEARGRERVPESRPAGKKTRSRAPRSCNTGRAWELFGRSIE